MHTHVRTHTHTHIRQAVHMNEASERARTVGRAGQTGRQAGGQASRERECDAERRERRAGVLA